MELESFSIGSLAVWHHPCPNPRARVLLVHGICEHSARHLNTIAALNAHGIEVIRFDLRGAGRSGGRRQWISSFSNYVDDVASVHNWIRGHLPRLPLYLLGHSLGGAIAIHFAALYGRDLDGLILSAPGYKLGAGISAWKVALGKAIVRFWPTLRMPDSSDHKALSRDPKVADEYAADPLSCHSNTLQQGDEILKAFEKAPERCARIATPTLIVHGSADQTILCEGSFTLFQALATKDKVFHVMPGGYHELHNDLDKEAYFGLLKNWFDTHLTGTISNVANEGSHATA